MTIRFFDVVWAAVIMSATNYIYQAAGDGMWAVAAERSFFQSGALLIFFATMKLAPNKDEPDRRRRPF